MKKERIYNEGLKMVNESKKDLFFIVINGSEQLKKLKNENRTHFNRPKKIKCIPRFSI